MKVTTQGFQRNFLLYSPHSLEAMQPLPLWILAPGTGETPQTMLEMSNGLGSYAEEQGFALAALEGVHNRMNVVHDAQAAPWRPNDVEYTSAVLRKVAQSVNVDKERVYCVGFSRGARFCSRVASELSTFFAGIAPISGVRFPRPNNATRPQPVLAFHGLKDAVNPFWGGGESYWHTGVPDAVQSWARFNGCKRKVKKHITSSIVMFQHVDCKDDADVALVQIEDGGHTWPGSWHDFGDGGKVTHDIDAKVLMAEFFAKHKQNSHCHTAVTGEPCFYAATWVIEHGFPEHPEWYEGLNRSSTFEDAQTFLHREFRADCPMPCPRTTSTSTRTVSTTTTTSLTTTSSSTSTTVTPTTTSTTTTTTTTADLGPLGWLRTVIHLAVFQDSSAAPPKPVEIVQGPPLYFAGVVIAATSAMAVPIWFIACRRKLVGTCQRRDIVGCGKFHVLINL